MPKTPFTLEDHKEAGDLLTAALLALTRLSVKITNSYPKTVGHAAKGATRIDRATRQLAAAKSVLEAQLAMERRDLSDQELLSVYYGKPKKITITEAE
jgi:hypothetical protein